jgi:Ni2+-binding GTPase involved in maturation of urease and hydrogenase
MIQRALIHVGGPPGAGKTAFVERLVTGSRHWVLAVRCLHRPPGRRPW